MLQKKEEEARIERKREKEALRSYSGVFEPEKMNTNKRRNIEEDFMQLNQIDKSNFPSNK